jgi:regulatory protein
MKRPTLEEAKRKIYRYCAYQERSHKEVKSKLYSYGVFSHQIEEIIVELIADGFLSEERFARTFARGKFRMKKWGKLKIVRELETRDVSRNCIKLALEEIKPEEYTRSLRHLLEKKLSSLDIANPFVKRDKAARFAITKGFEPDLVWSELRVLLPD